MNFIDALMFLHIYSSQTLSIKGRYSNYLTHVTGWHRTSFQNVLYCRE
jgi:hypothetical protein